MTHPTPSTNYDEIIAKGIALLSTGDTYSMHLINGGKTPDHGYIEIAISKGTRHVESWRETFKRGNNETVWSPTSLSTIIAWVDGLDFDGSALMNRDQFKNVVGHDLQMYCNDIDDTLFMGLASDRVVMIRRAFDWKDIEELYASYLRPTRH